MRFHRPKIITSLFSFAQVGAVSFLSISPSLYLSFRISQISLVFSQ
jgi:hypothetical protein